MESATRCVNQNIYKPRILQAVALWLCCSAKLKNYNLPMERKIFWMVFTVLGLLADFLLPLWWGLAATVPCLFIAWWVAYRSEWF
jgi:hypothetical protein